jgi:HEAT repeat protein
LGLLANEQINHYVRWRIATTLGVVGEQSVVPQLLSLLANERVYGSVRWHIADALAMLVDKEGDVQLLADIMSVSKSYLDDYVYRALWTTSRRVGVRVLVRNEAGKERLEVVRR